MKDFHTTFHFRQHLIGLTIEEIQEVMREKSYTHALILITQIRRQKANEKHDNLDEKEITQINPDDRQKGLRVYEV